MIGAKSSCASSSECESGGNWPLSSYESFLSCSHSSWSALRRLRISSPDNFALISRKTTHKFDPSGIMFDGHPIERRDAVKLVGYTFDEKMTWSTMIDTMAKKARQRLGMLSRLRPLLSDENMKAMYVSFIRPVMEHGSMQFMGADKIHLEKFDKIQRRAMKIGNFKVNSLRVRREANAIGFTLKLLDGDGRGILDSYKPKFINDRHGHETQSSDKGPQLVDRSTVGSLLSFDRSYLGCIHKIWSRLPKSLTLKGLKVGWIKIKKDCKKFITEEK
jgi:hypothetical protein